GPLVVQPDLVGAYGFTPLSPPHVTPAGSRSEAILATLRMATRRGRRAEVERLAAALRDTLRFLLARQIRPDGAWLMPSPAEVDGGFVMSDVSSQIRIDYLQHIGSALLRAAALADHLTDETRGLTDN